MTTILYENHDENEQSQNGHTSDETEIKVANQYEVRFYFTNISFAL